MVAFLFFYFENAIFINAGEAIIRRKIPAFLQGKDSYLKFSFTNDILALFLIQIKPSWCTC